MVKNTEKEISFIHHVCSDLKEFGLLEEEIIAPCPLLVSQAVRVHKQNSRQGTVAVKSRSDLVSRSNKKPWKQKGTGRARAGTPRSPLWRGGGVCFGPQPRTRVLSLNKKMRHLSLRYLFLNLLDNRGLVCLNIKVEEKKTSKVVHMIKDIQNSLKKENNFTNENDSIRKKNEKIEKAVLLYDINDLDTFYSFSNVKNIEMVSYDAIHSYLLADTKKVYYLHADSEKFYNVVKKWLI
jgi:large subunit ribosomal protein L4